MKRGVLAAVVLLGAALAVDLVGGAVLMENGMYRGWRPLPPFGVITHPPRQEAWLERVERELAGEAEASLMTEFDAELGWITRAGAVVPGIGASSNEARQRGSRSYARERPAGGVRVVSFGDSFTWCDEVPDEASWQAALERERSDWEVLNLGVGGYGTGQALLRFRREGTWDAQVVCIGILLENVGRNVNRYRPRWYPMADACVTKPRFVASGEGELELVPQPFATRAELVAAVRDGSVLERTEEHEYWWRPSVPALLEWSFLTRLAKGREAYALRKTRDLWLDTTGEPYRTSVAILETFHREALAAGAELAPVVIFQGKEDLQPLAEESVHFWADLVATLEARGIPVIDLGPPLAERWRETGGAGVYTGSHLSPESNELVADVIGAWIAARLED